MPLLKGPPPWRTHPSLIVDLNQQHNASSQLSMDLKKSKKCNFSKCVKKFDPFFNYLKKILSISCQCLKRNFFIALFFSNFGLRVDCPIWLFQQSVRPELNFSWLGWFIFSYVLGFFWHFEISWSMNRMKFSYLKLLGMNRCKYLGVIIIFRQNINKITLK